MHNDVIILIPTKRPPPLVTLDAYNAQIGVTPFQIMADPDVFHAHVAHYGSGHVVCGNSGLGWQLTHCYNYAYRVGFNFFFRMDDDLPARTFVGREANEWHELNTVIDACREAAIATRTSLVGVSNSSRRDWLSHGHGRTYGLIHGGAQLVRSAYDPTPFINPNVSMYEDVYRSCAHRRADGAVGRVRFIGFDKSKSVNALGATSSHPDDEAARQREIALILAEFPGYVTCDGLRLINNGRTAIPNWRMRRHPTYQAK